MMMTPCLRLAPMAFVLSLAACATGSPSATTQPPPAAQAVATLSPAPGGSLRGLVTFTDRAGHVEVHVVATGLPPGSAHGLHVHETGNCASADFGSAGGHFNPDHLHHGPQGGEHHAGDLPMVSADAQGRVDARFAIEGAALSGSRGFVGHSVIVHEGADDYTTQPTGNSGGRIACGVIAALD